MPEIAQLESEQKPIQTQARGTPELVFSPNPLVFHVVGSLLLKVGGIFDGGLSPCIIVSVVLEVMTVHTLG